MQFIAVSVFAAQIPAIGMILLFSLGILLIFLGILLLVWILLFSPQGCYVTYYTQCAMMQLCCQHRPRLQACHDSSARQ